jgi:predicted ArsR family transcriptional regulator
MFRQQLLDSSRGRIVVILQRGGLTVEKIASQLGLTPNAVRAQLTAMERDGVAHRARRVPGTTRPSYVYELTPEVEQLLSRAYLPLLTHLVDAFAEQLPGEQVDALLRATGTRLAQELSDGKASDDLHARVERASVLMNEQLGAVTHVERNGGYVIRGAACPLAALTGKHPSVCRAMESFVAEVVGQPARECCDRDNRPRCCFIIAT